MSGYMLSLNGVVVVVVTAEQGVLLSIIVFIRKTNSAVSRPEPDRVVLPIFG